MMCVTTVWCPICMRKVDLKRGVTLSAKVNLRERLYEKNLIPVGANSAFWLSRHDRVDPAVQAKVFIWRKVGSAWWVTLQSQKTDTPPAKPPFLFLV